MMIISIGSESMLSLNQMINLEEYSGLGEEPTWTSFIRMESRACGQKILRTPIDYGKLPASNIYGSHPYFMYKHKSNSWVGSIIQTGCCSRLVDS
jgi:hypothetical protein